MYNNIDHYHVQVVEEIYNPHAAAKMGVESVGQVCVMIHSGSRGLGHQVATDALVEMEKAMKRDNIVVNDRQVCVCDVLMTDYLLFIPCQFVFCKFSEVLFSLCLNFASLYLLSLLNCKHLIGCLIFITLCNSNLLLQNYYYYDDVCVL